MSTLVLKHNEEYEDPLLLAWDAASRARRSELQLHRCQNMRTRVLKRICF